jgi:DME family drug/metabolite transporter
MIVSRLYILLAALLWSTAGAAIKLSSLDAWQISAGRSGVAALVFALGFPSARRMPSLRTLWVSAAYAATVVLFVLANKKTTAANAIFIQDCAPLYIMLLSPWVLGEKPQRSELLAAPVFAAGMVLFFVERLGPGAMVGNLLAVASGVAFAFCIMGLRLLRNEGNAPSMMWGNALAFVVSLPFTGQGPSPTAADAGIILFLGVFQLGAAYAAFGRGVRDVPATEASLLVLLEPVLSAVWAAWLAAEIPGPYARLGALVVLLATLWRTVAAARAPAAVDASKPGTQRAPP